MLNKILIVKFYIAIASLKTIGCMWEYTQDWIKQTLVSVHAMKLFAE